MDKVIKPFNQKTFTLGLGAALGGILIGLAGLILVLLRVRLAVAFLGARTLFNMPLDQSDVVKIGIVALVALAVLLVGFVTFASGTIVSLVQFSRKSSN